MPRKRLEEMKADYIGLLDVGFYGELLNQIFRKGRSQLKKINNSSPDKKLFYMILGEINKNNCLGEAKIFDCYGWANCDIRLTGGEIRFSKEYTPEAIKRGGSDTPIFYHGVRDIFNLEFLGQKEMIIGYYQYKDHHPNPFVMVRVSDLD